VLQHCIPASTVYPGTALADILRTMRLGLLPAHGGATLDAALLASIALTAEVGVDLPTPLGCERRR
jgi:hypothetical protein